MRRRTFLLAAGLAGAVPQICAGPVAKVVDPARLLAHELGNVLLEAPADAAPANVATLRASLGAAERAFSACEYVPLARSLPDIITSAEATATRSATTTAQQILAQSYNLTTCVLMKLEASGLEWIAADRAMHAARVACEPLTLAESQRLIAAVTRRAGDHRRAESLTLDAADILPADRTATPEHLAMYAKLYCSAGYAAARGGDRDRAEDLNREAESVLPRLTEHPALRQHVAANIISHRVSAAYVLGDAGGALAQAHKLPLAAVPTVERRARLLVDIAQAYMQWDKPEKALSSLIVAERAAPGEVRTRGAVRRLVAELAASPRRSDLSALPALASRVHAKI